MRMAPRLARGRGWDGGRVVAGGGGRGRAGGGCGLVGAGEARSRLGPLAVPGIGPNEPGHYAAVELFADRASRVDPGFALDGTTGPVIGQVGARLGGVR